MTRRNDTSDPQKAPNFDVSSSHARVAHQNVMRQWWKVVTVAGHVDPKREGRWGYLVGGCDKGGGPLGDLGVFGGDLDVGHRVLPPVEQREQRIRCSEVKERTQRPRDTHARTHRTHARHMCTRSTWEGVARISTTMRNARLSGTRLLSPRSEITIKKTHSGVWPSPQHR